MSEYHDHDPLHPCSIDHDADSLADLDGPEPEPEPEPDRFPEHTKLAAISDKSQAIGEFVDWLGDVKGVTLAHHETWEGYSAPQYVPYQPSIQRLLAEFFEIDLDKIEAEKRAMLDALRAAAT